MHFKCHFCWAIRVWREWPLHSAQIVLRRSPPPCIYYCLVWWSVGGTMQFHHLWEGSFWLRHDTSKVVQTFCHRNAVWEARDIIYWNALHMGALQHTHAQMWAGGVSLWRAEKKGDQITFPKCGILPFPLLPSEQCGDGPCCLYENRNNISLLIPAAGFYYKPNIFQRV